ncbi:MAG: hypothetical protein ACR2MO_05365 [Acidimicrobiales bacterium]
MRRWDSFFVVLAVAVGVSACGADRTGGPRGEPQAVVDASPDRTVAAGAAAFDATAPDAERSGKVAFGAAGRASSPEPGRNSADHPELTDPGSVVDLVRGALASVSYGGAAVRGTSTFRYETVINVERAVAETPSDRRPRMEAFAESLGAPAFYADVWIDGEGRLRRIQVPVEKTTQRPPDRAKELPRLVTVDFFDFEG